MSFLATICDSLKAGGFDARVEAAYLEIRFGGTVFEVFPRANGLRVEFEVRCRGMTLLGDDAMVTDGSVLYALSGSVHRAHRCGVLSDAELVEFRALRQRTMTAVGVD